MTVEVFTLDGDEAVKQLIDVVQLGLDVAMEAELISPENESNLKAWVAAEKFRLGERRHTTKRDPFEYLRKSKWHPFWESLKPGGMVKWVDTIKPEYEVVQGPCNSCPDQTFKYSSGGPYFELRRSTGKTFWVHVVMIRPIGYVRPEKKT